MVSDLPFPRILMVPELTQFPSLWVSTRDLSGILALELPQNLLLRRNRVIKQVSDYVLTIPLFFLSLPVLMLAALAIKVSSRGPIFYAQEREGLGHQKFRMWKLRTMYRDAEDRLEDHLAENPKYRAEWDNHMKLKHDPRVIPGIGRWLRKTSIDELPQLWDVLRGKMSLIGSGRARFHGIIWKSSRTSRASFGAIFALASPGSGKSPAGARRTSRPRRSSTCTTSATGPSGWISTSWCGPFQS
jgi:lipopolysaccharide/colanic/teichoic acid biosynthesis glycosyltransferase